MTEGERGAALAEAATGRTVVAVRRLGGGYANTTLRVDLDRGRPVVVRLYRRAPEVAATEAAVLARAGAEVPVPGVLLADPVGEVTGVPALVLEQIDGTSGDVALAGSAPAERLAIGHALGTALAPLGRIRFPQAGFFAGPDLEPGGAPDAPASAQLAGFIHQAFDDQTVVPGDLADAWADLVVDRAGVLDTVPADTVLVHADYNPKNVLVTGGGRSWTVAAVLDWEFAFAGTPLHDLGNVLRWAHREPRGYVDAVAAGFAGAGGRLSPRWREAAAAFDAFSLCDFVRRGVSGELRDGVAALMAAMVHAGDLVIPEPP